MGCTVCTEPQCLYKGALYLTVELYLYFPLWAVRSVQSLSACTRVHFTFSFTVHLVRFIIQTNKCTTHTHTHTHTHKYIIYTGWAKSRYTVYYILYAYVWPTRPHYKGKVIPLQA